MQNRSFHDIVLHLTDEQTPRVWSLLVTVFGELAQDKGARISGSLLRALCELIGIKPEAMRVAIHRLRKDGWIDSERSGRNSAYFLTDWGRAQTVQASPRIYSTRPAADQAWLVLFNPAAPQQAVSASGVWVASNVLVTSEHLALDDVFTASLETEASLPNWMRNKVCSDDVVTQSRLFASTLDTLESQLATVPKLDPLEISALRVLLVHSWRRIVLKAPVLPDYAYPTHWRGAECRDQVARLLEQFPKEELSTLQIATESGGIRKRTD